MTHEKSCGAVVYKLENQTPYFMIIESINNHFSFPKGHMEGNETEVETALREIKEETNLSVELDESYKSVVTYYPYPDVEKNVIFYVAKALHPEELKKQDLEILSAQWLTLEEALPILSWPNDINTLKEANQHILKN